MSQPYKFSPTPSEILKFPKREQSEKLEPNGLPSSPKPNKASSVYVTPLILKVDGLIKIYGQRRVVDGVSFYVNRGEIVGLLGPNGAGKTTSFRMTCGMLDASGGIVYLNGKDVTNWPMFRRAREGGMGYLPQDKSVFSGLTVQDNLLAVMELLGIDYKTRRQRCDELLEKFKLSHLRKNLAGSGGQSGGLSGGERRRLEIARALVSDPKIILLDEPFANIDPITVAGIQKIIKQLSEESISILITDHQVRETLQITHRSYVIQNGSVLCHGTPQEVLANEEARRVYFGEDVGIHHHGMASTPTPPETPPHTERPQQTPKPPKPTIDLEPTPEIPIRPRPQFAHTSNSGRPITGNSSQGKD